jgi:predicted permease
MDFLRTFLTRCTALFRRRQLDADLDDELRAHIDLATDEFIQRGLLPAEARTQALRVFGGLTQTREAYRIVRDVPLFTHFGRDLRYALRQLHKSPNFTLAAVLTLALGIGANSAVFSVLNALLLRPLPFPNADRIVRIYSVARGIPIGPSPLDSRDFARESHTFAKIAVFDQWRKNVVTANASDLPESLHVGLGSLDLFQALGVEPVLGRLFTADEGITGRNHVVLLTESFWQNHYARNPSILGQTVTINNFPYTIIGVIPDTIPGWLRGSNAPIELWEPFLPSPKIWDEMQRGGRDFTTVGLLKPGVTLPEAQADLETIAAHLAAAYPIDRNIGVLVQPLVVSRAGDLRPQLYLLMAAVTLILLIACSNLAALLLARNTARQREFALRAALGAGRALLIRQILVETLVVSLTGATCGIALAAAIDFLIRRYHPQRLALLSGVILDARVLLFTLLTAIGAALVFGLAPAVFNTRIHFVEALKEGARGSSAPVRHWFRKALVTGQVALSLMLTVGAALFAQTILHLVHQDMGFRVDHLLKAHFFIPDEQYPTPGAKTRFSDTFSERLRALPGVLSVSITTIYPPYERWSMLFSIEGHPVSRAEDVPSTFFGVTDASYLRTVGIALLRGRDFAATDRENTPAVALVNQTFARRFFPHDDPLGKLILLGAPPTVSIQDTWIQGHNVPVTIIGVMTDSKDDGPALPVAPQLITLFRQTPDVNYGFKEVLVRSDLAPQILSRSMQQQLHALNPRLPLSEIASMDAYIDDLTSDKRFTGFILAAFAALGLVLSLIGIYGVVSYLVAQRTHELAIRLALGAHRIDVLWLMARQGFGLAIAGVAIGLVGIALANRSLAGLLYGISALDLLTLSAASFFLLTVAILASYLPARRTTTINPMQALRND